MKNLILLLALSISSLALAQQSPKYIEGVATVSVVTDKIAVVVFGRNGHSASSFIIDVAELDPAKPPLESGKLFEFILQPFFIEGSDVNCKLVWYHIASRQIDREKAQAKRLLDKKHKASITYIWL